MDFKDFLETKIEPSKKKTIWQNVLSGDDLAFASLTFGDLLYDIARLDPLVLEGIDFSRAANLDSIPAFAEFASGIMSKTGQSFDSNIAQMKGYVAERYVAETLRRQGAEVEFPAASNQPGYDLLVNGDEFQVKCWETTEGVERHFEKYPDIPVFVNEELAEPFQGNDMIFPVWGVRNDQVEADTIENLDAASEILDLEIPIFAAAIVAAKNVYGVATRKTDFENALRNVAEGTAVRTAGGTGGAMAAALSMSAIGITGGWATIIIPALGAVGGHSIARRMHEKAIGAFMCKKEKQHLVKALKAYLSALLSKLDWMKAKAISYSGNIESHFSGTSNVVTYWKSDWKRRLNEENDFRCLYAQKIQCALDHGGMFHKTENLIESSIEALRITAHVGILPQNLLFEGRDLLEACSVYAEKLQKKII